MAKFVYKMENILSVKYKLEDQAKNVFAEANLALNEEEEKLSNLYARKEEYERQLSGEVMGTLQVLEIRRIAEAVEVVKYYIKMQIIAVNSAKQRVERARIKLNQAIVERKIQEKLKEKISSVEDKINSIKNNEKEEVVQKEETVEVNENNELPPIEAQEEIVPETTEAPVEEQTTTEE